jgi:hypothetical protein
MAVHDEQADVATVELTGSGVDIILPAAVPPPRPPARGRLLVAIALATASLVVGAVQLVGIGGIDLVPSVAPADRILPSGAPRPQTLARQGSVVLFVPIEQSRITAILYHPVAGTSGLRLEPIGKPVDGGVLGRIVAGFAGADAGGPPYAVEGDPRSVDVGAPVGTDVYAPADGKVLSITPVIVEGVEYGDQIAIEPLANPGVVVVASGLKAAADLSVGSPVSTRPDAWTRIGRLIDVTPALDPALAAYTQDGGNRVQLEVRPATEVAAT